MPALPEASDTLKLVLESDAGAVEEELPVAPLSVPPVVSSAKEPSRPAKVEESDRLRIANLHLMVENCTLQERYLQGELHRAHAAREEHYAKLVALRGELSVKYGIDFSKVKLRQDGTIEYIAEGAAGFPPALAALLRQGG